MITYCFFTYRLNLFSDIKKLTIHNQRICAELCYGLVKTYRPEISVEINRHIVERIIRYFATADENKVALVINFPSKLIAEVSALCKRIAERIKAYFIIRRIFLRRGSVIACDSKSAYQLASVAVTESFFADRFNSIWDFHVFERGTKLKCVILNRAYSLRDKNLFESRTARKDSI